MITYNGLKETYMGLRFRELKHRFTYIKSYNRMSDALRRYDSCSGKKEGKSIRHERNVCKKYWHCYPLHYYRYNQYLSEMQLSDDQLKDYIPEFFFYSVFLPFYDSKKYEILLEDKNITEVLFRSLEIPSPQTLLKWIGGGLYTPDLRETSIQEVIKKANALGCSKLFLKPANGQGGFGISVFHRNDSGGYQDPSGKSLYDLFVKQTSLFRSKDYILQAGLSQHKSLSELYPSSINTFRIVTESKEGAARILCSIVRIGSGGREVDNICQGGIILKLDNDTGKAGKYGITEIGTKYARHPDSGFIFENFQVPDWNIIRTFALECALKLPQFTYLGWDIALTDDGPVAIEANLGFGIDLLQIALGGLRKTFGITDPDFYWRNQGKRAGRI